MRNIKYLLVLALLAATSAAAGTIDVLPSPNAFGLYFDGEAVGSDLTIDGPTTSDAYLIFTDPTITSLNGWEVKVTVSSGASVTGVAYPQGTTAGKAGPADWSATMAAPMPCNALTKLAVFSITSDATQNISIYLGSVDNPSVAGDLPAVRQPDGSWVSVPVTSGDPALPVAGINSTTPNDELSWGSVKSLFR